MPRKCFKQQYRLFCELKKIFSDHTVSYDKVIKLENKNNTEQKIEVDIFIENFFSKSVHLFIENDGYLWHKDKRDKDLEKSLLITMNGHHIVRAIDDRLESLNTDNEVFYKQSKEFLPYLIQMCKIFIDLLKNYQNNESKILLLENYVSNHIYINDEEFFEYYNNGKVPNSLLEIYPNHALEYSIDNQLKPYAINCGSNEKYIWDCLICQNKYKKTVSNKIKFGCDNCRKIRQQNESKDKLKIIFDKIKYNNELTQSEKYFLQDKRQAKLGKGNGCVFYDSDQELADSYQENKIKNIFNLYDAELESNHTCNKYCDFLRDNDGNHPYQNSEYEHERELSNWRYRKLGILKNGNGVFYKSDFEIAKDRGYEYIFDLADSPEFQQNKAAKEIIDWSESNNFKRPNSDSKDPVEADHGIKIGTFMRNVNEKQSSGGKFFDSTKQLFINAGLYDIFFTPTKIRLERESNSNTIQIIKFIENNNRLPKQNKINKNENELANWLNKKRRTKAGKIKGIWYESDQRIAEDNNLELLFEQGFVLPKDYQPKKKKTNEN
jgi:hypothetical protein